MHRNEDPGNGHRTAAELDPRALAAAIGAAAVAVERAGRGDSAGVRESTSRWRMQGRRDLFRSRLGSAS